MGILIAAGITTALAALGFGLVLRRLVPAGDGRRAVLAWAIALPLQPLAFHLLRLPLHAALRELLGEGTALALLSLSYAPLTEEPAKWLVLLVPAVRRALRPENALGFALAIGLGFGIGEIWFLAERLLAQPGVAALPFWMFGGFLVERLEVCFLHGAFIAFAVQRLAEGRAFWPGAVLGVALHFLTNLPILLVGLDPFGLGREFWAGIVSLYLLGIVLAMIVALRRLAKRTVGLELIGTSTCPECGAAYPRPLLAANLGPWRYERCPHCRRFHLIRL